MHSKMKTTCKAQWGKDKPAHWKRNTKGCTETKATRKQLYKHNEYYCHGQTTQKNIIGATHIIKPDRRKQLQGGIPKTDTNTYKNNTIYCSITQQWQCVHCPKTFQPQSKRNDIMHTFGHIQTIQKGNPLQWEEWPEEQKITRDTRIRTLLNYGKQTTTHTPMEQPDNKNKNTPQNTPANNEE